MDDNSPQQVKDHAHEEYEFEAIPLVPTRVIRVRFRDVGELPPPEYFKDEVFDPREA